MYFHNGSTQYRHYCKDRHNDFKVALIIVIRIIVWIPIFPKFINNYKTAIAISLTKQLFQEPHKSIHLATLEIRKTQALTNKHILVLLTILLSMSP